MRRATGSAHHEEIIRRSRFIGDSTPVTTREHAEDAISRRRNEHPGASHVVYAYATGGERDQQFGMSDDGEPKGTAGRPILEILKGSGLTDCLVTVVRYFGGTKLGTGGLVHAYGGVARQCIDSTPNEPRINTVKRVVQVPYELQQPVAALLQRYNCSTVNQDFGTMVTIQTRVPEAFLDELATELRNVSRGTITLREASG